MDTDIDHTSISIPELSTYNLSIGRVKEPEQGIALVNADIREGRTLQQRTDLALAFMGLINEALNISTAQIYISLTEHKGEDFHLFEKIFLKLAGRRRSVNGLDRWEASLHTIYGDCISRAQRSSTGIFCIGPGDKDKE